jgi:hypothetical protein
MPDFVLTLLGVVGGLLVIAGAIYFAVQPEFRPKRRKSWLAKPSDQPLSAVDSSDVRWMTGSGDGGSGHSG